MLKVNIYLVLKKCVCKICLIKFGINVFDFEKIYLYYTNKSNKSGISVFGSNHKV